MIHGAAVRLWIRFGLFAIEALTHPSVLSLKVPAAPGSLLARFCRTRSRAGVAKIGRHTLRRRAGAAEVCAAPQSTCPAIPSRSLPGRPRPARRWVARLVLRARARRCTSHYLVIDIGVTMREGRPAVEASITLDRAVSLALCRLRWPRATGVGLLPSTVRVCGTQARRCSTAAPERSPSGRSRAHERRRKRFVAMTDGELVAAVARYLRQQEGLDARIRRAPADGTIGLPGPASLSRRAVNPSRSPVGRSPPRRLLPTREGRRARPPTCFTSQPPSSQPRRTAAQAGAA